MPSKSFGETLLRGAARIAEPLAKHDLARRVARGEEDATRAGERDGLTDLARPEGTLIWCHVAGLSEAVCLNGVIGQIRLELPEASFLITTQDRVQDFMFAMRLAGQALHQYAPMDNPVAVGRFLDHWNPDLCVWADNVLMPLLNTEVARREIPAILANVNDVERANPHIRWFPSIRKPALRNFQKVLVTDEATGVVLGRFAPDVEVMGILYEEALALPHNEVRRARLSRQLHGRPIWLAAHVSEDEIEDVMEAEYRALRTTHRLMLILAPDTEDGIEMARTVADQKGLVWKNSTDLEDLPARVDVIIAEKGEGLGLWYQLASVCFLGRSLAEHGGCSPLEAAGLGSAVIHGPYVNNYADTYLRLCTAGAAIEVASVPSLAEAVGEMIVPDRAAEMAHAGWMICSEGANATDALVSAIWDFLPIGAQA